MWDSNLTESLSTGLQDFSYLFLASHSCGEVPTSTDVPEKQKPPGLSRPILCTCFVGGVTDCLTRRGDSSHTSHFPAVGICSPHKPVFHTSFIKEFLNPLINICLKYLYIQTIVFWASWNQRVQIKGWWWKQSENVKFLLLWSRPMTMSSNSQPCLQLVSEDVTPTVSSSQSHSVYFPIWFLIYIFLGSQDSRVSNTVSSAFHLAKERLQSIQILKTWRKSNKVSQTTFSCFSACLEICFHV